MTDDLTAMIDGYALCTWGLRCCVACYVGLVMVSVVAFWGAPWPCWLALGVIYTLTALALWAISRETRRRPFPYTD